MMEVFWCYLSGVAICVAVGLIFSIRHGDIYPLGCCTAVGLAWPFLLAWAFFWLLLDGLAAVIRHLRLGSKP